MKKSCKFGSKYGSFILEITGDYVGVNNAARPSNSDCHYSQLADINQFIKSMESLGICAVTIFYNTMLILSSVDGVYFIESW
jgi:hypothetical protein